jgi:hypothetical protein
MPRLLALALCSTFLAPAAYAVTGDAPVQWAPGTRGEPIAHADVQERLNRAPAWQDHLQRRGDWTARWDEATRVPAQMWGQGVAIDADALADDVGAWDVGYALLAEDTALHGVDLADLQPLIINRDAGMTVVTFQRTHMGLPVVDARVSLRFKQGRFVMAQYDSMPGVADHVRTATSQLSPDEAIKAATSALGWAIEETEYLGSELIILPRLTSTDATYRLAWQVDLRSTVRPTHKIAYVDARSGELLRWNEQVRHVDGTVSAEHDDRFPQQGLIVTGMPYALVESADGSWESDHTGALEFDVTEDTAVTFRPGSRWWAVDDQSGTPAVFDGVLSPDGAELLAIPSADLDETAARFVRAQIDVSQAAHTVRDRARRINPLFAWATQQADAHVNIDDGGCNAFFDGDINFLRQSNQCNNTARVADVVYHEYGHGFHVYSIVQGAGAFDGAMGEGLGDYMAATITGDPATARGFYRNSTQPLRDIAPNHVWPQDVGEIHFTGIILAGALWDLRTELIATYGEEEGILKADDIFWNVARLSSDIPDSYADALLADDDNGDLADGTPNKCMIDEVFGLHGLGVASDEAGLFSIAHEPPSEVAADAAVALPMTVELARPDCTTGEVRSVLVHWSTDGVNFETLELEGEGDLEASLPSAPSGTLIRYWIEALSPSGQRLGMAPRGSITDPWYGVTVGGLEEIYFEDFEASDGKYISELIAGDPEREGADDWGWGAPQGQAGDPMGCWSGDRCWGNDISPEPNWNGAYQRNVHNVLRSPLIEVGDLAEVHLQFRRWLTVEDGVFDDATLRVNGVVVWEQHSSGTQEGGEHHEDTHWALRSYDITDLVDDGMVEIEWEIVADGGLQLGGWNVDDVRIVGRTRDFVDTAAGTPDPEDGLSGNGCSGCSTGSGATPMGLLLFPMLLLVRRRR